MMPQYVCTSLSTNLLGQKSCNSWLEYSPVVTTTTDSTANQYSCLKFDSLSNCVTWQIKQDSSVFAPIYTMSVNDKNQLTVSIIGFLVVVWVFLWLKRFIR